MLRQITLSGLTLFTLITTYPAVAETPAQILASIQSEGVSAVSAKNGEQFFKTKHGQEWSCASCHTDNPAAEGKHAITGKVIQPLAPTANAERFTEPKKVAKWFKRNCNDVLNRECTAQEKADVMAYLMSVKK